VLLFTLVSHHLTFSQSVKIDSLLNLLKKDKEDTTKIFHLNVLSREFIINNSFDSALHYSNKTLQLGALILSQSTTEGSQTLLKQPALKGMANAFNFAGVVFDVKGDYQKSLEHYNKALKIYEDLADKKGIAKLVGNIGRIYSNQGETGKALDCYLKSIKLVKEGGNKKEIANALGNLGTAYWDHGDHPKAFEYYFNALKIVEEIGDKNGIALHLSDIGNVYNRQRDYKKALYYYFKALKIYEEAGNKNDLARVLGNIATVYTEQARVSLNKLTVDSLNKIIIDYYYKALKTAEEVGNKNLAGIWLGNIGTFYNEEALKENNSIKRNKSFELALEYYSRAFKVAEEIGDKNRMAIWLSDIGSLYYSSKNYTEAEKALLSALKIDSLTGYLVHAEHTFKLLSLLYSEKGDYKKSLEYYKKSALTKDSLFNEEKNKELTRHEMNYEFEKKEASSKAEQDKKDAVTMAEKKKQQTVLLLVSCVLILVFIFAGFVFRSLRLTRKQKLLIEIKNKETEEQKTIIEMKRKDILDSIYYARKIQKSLMTNEKYIENKLKELTSNENAI